MYAVYPCGVSWSVHVRLPQVGGILASPAPNTRLPDSWVWGKTQNFRRSCIGPKAPAKTYFFMVKSRKLFEKNSPETVHSLWSVTPSTARTESVRAKPSSTWQRCCTWELFQEHGLFQKNGLRLESKMMFEHVWTHEWWISANFNIGQGTTSSESHVQLPDPSATQCQMAPASSPAAYAEQRDQQCHSLRKIESYGDSVAGVPPISSSRHQCNLVQKQRISVDLSHHHKQWHLKHSCELRSRLQWWSLERSRLKSIVWLLVDAWSEELATTSPHVEVALELLDEAPLSKKLSCLKTESKRPKEKMIMQRAFSNQSQRHLNRKSSAWCLHWHH